MEPLTDSDLDEYVRLHAHGELCHRDSCGIVGRLLVEVCRQRNEINHLKFQRDEARAEAAHWANR